MWPGTPIASVDPIPLLGVLQQCVRLPSSYLGRAYVKLALGLEPRKVHRFPPAVQQSGWPGDVFSELTVALGPVGICRAQLCSGMVCLRVQHLSSACPSIAAVVPKPRKNIHNL